MARISVGSRKFSEILLISILNSIFQVQKKKLIHTGSVEDEKQEILDDLSGHLKIGKDFTIFANFQMTR